ncbi:MAG TPA: hypothetical protein VF945_09970 [Polyangia bacterium]
MEVLGLSGHINDVRLHHPLVRVRRRLRMQAALEGGAAAAVVAAALLLVGVYLWRLHALGGRGLLAVGLTAAGVVLAGVVARAIARIPLDRAALQIDATHGLHDRVRSALAFTAEPAPTPFMQAAVADAEEAAHKIDARRAAPLVRPEALTPAAILVGVTALVALLHFPTGSHALPDAPRPPHLVVDRSLLDPEVQAARALEAAAKEAGDVDGQQLANELNRLLTQIDAEELTRKQAFDKLAELENKYLHADDGELEYLKDKLRKAGAELGKSKLLEETGKSLKDDDVEKARKELEKLAAEAEKIDAKWDKRQREEAAKALEQAAKQTEQDQKDKARADEEKRLREEERQLRKQLAEKPNDAELQRRLERNQRELQRLEREKQERAAEQRQLQRLQRELEKAAEQLRQKLSPEALKQLAQQMRQMENEISKLSSQSRAQMQIAEIKEVLRRAGQSSSGAGNKQGMAQKDGKGKQQRGRNGQGGRGEELREFDQRAGGKDPSVMLLGGDGKDSDSRLLLPLPMGPNGNQPGQNGDGKDPGRDPGDGIGDQHDPNLMGDATRMNAQRHETRVQGKDGAGPSRSQTILGSAEKGFASTGYKRVYGDYTAVVEEVMSKEKVPPGYRFYVKRYFQLIKPRE